MNASVNDVIKDLERKKAEIDTTISQLRAVYSVNGAAPQAEPEAEKSVLPVLADEIALQVKEAGAAGIRKKFVRVLYQRRKDEYIDALDYLTDNGVLVETKRPGGGSRPYLYLVHKDNMKERTKVKVTGLVIDKPRRRRMPKNKPAFTLMEMLRETLEPGTRYNAQAAVNQIHKKYAYKPRRASVLAEMNRLMHMDIMKRLEKGMYYFPVNTGQQEEANAQ